jgi:hypothetical protein
MAVSRERRYHVVRDKIKNAQIVTRVKDVLEELACVVRVDEAWHGWVVGVPTREHQERAHPGARVKIADLHAKEEV